MSHPIAIGFENIFPTKTQRTLRTNKYTFVYLVALWETDLLTRNNNEHYYRLIILECQ